MLRFTGWIVENAKCCDCRHESVGKIWRQYFNSSLPVEEEEVDEGSACVRGAEGQAQHGVGHAEHSAGVEGVLPDLDARPSCLGPSKPIDEQMHVPCATQATEKAVGN